PTEFYTLSLHDALPISEIQVRRGSAGGEARSGAAVLQRGHAASTATGRRRQHPARNQRLLLRLSHQTARVSEPLPRVLPARRRQDRKSTRLNSSHLGIS